MKIAQNSRARLLVEIPVERYRVLSTERRTPQAGDVVALDQGFTSEDGLPMVLVYFPVIGNDSLYVAEVYASELE